MKPTIAWLQSRFEHFNELMFGTRLTPLPIELSSASTYMGQCVSKLKRLPDGRKIHTDFRLRISIRIDLPEREVEDILIHEMIHYFILSSGLQDTSAHGAIFRAVMQSINTTHGRSLSISKRLTPEQREAAVSARRTWHVIAAIQLRNGSWGVKVLPRVAEKIIHYHRHVSASPQVASVELYLHDAPFFNTYPTSSALRMHPIDAAILQEHLTGAHRLTIKGNKIIQH